MTGILLSCDCVLCGWVCVCVRASKDYSIMCLFLVQTKLSIDFGHYLRLMRELSPREMADKSQWPDSIDQWSGLNALIKTRALSFSLFFVEMCWFLFYNNVIRWSDPRCIFSAINYNFHRMQVHFRWINTFPLKTTKFWPLHKTLFCVHIGGCVEIEIGKEANLFCEINLLLNGSFHAIEYLIAIVFGAIFCCVQKSILSVCFIVVYFWSFYVWQVHTFHWKMNPN